MYYIYDYIYYIYLVLICLEEFLYSCILFFLLCFLCFLYYILKLVNFKIMWKDLVLCDFKNNKS